MRSDLTASGCYARLSDIGILINVSGIKVSFIRYFRSVTPDVYSMNSEEKSIELFWIFFPAARDVLHNAKAFNDANSCNAYFV
jgi:hypothetical protein